MKTKKVPLRKCVACGESKPKKELIRILKNSDLEVKIDITGKANGRGAYICNNLKCLELAQKSNKLSRALETKIPIEIYENLRAVIESEINK